MAKSDAQVAADLLTIRDNLLELIIEVTAEANPTYSMDGELISWNAYLGRLNESLDAVNKKIAAQTKAVVSVDWNEGGLVMAELTLWLSNVRIDGAHGTLIGEHDGKTYELTEVEQT